MAVLNSSMSGLPFRRAMVVSTMSRAVSQLTTMPARIWPSSMRLATSRMPFKTPRHALLTS